MRQIITAKRGGNIASLYPVGCSSIEDLPCDLSIAIEQGCRIALWYENYTEEEMPPKWMWHLEWELETHFEEIEQIRKSKYGDSDSSDMDSGGSYDQNELADRFKR